MANVRRAREWQNNIEPDLAWRRLCANRLCANRREAKHHYVDMARNGAQIVAQLLCAAQDSCLTRVFSHKTATFGADSSFSTYQMDRILPNV